MVKKMTVSLFSLLSVVSFMFVTADRADATIYPCAGTTLDGQVCMIIDRSGKKINNITLEWPAFQQGSTDMRFTIKGYRTVTGGQSQLIGPHPLYTKVCANNENCLHKFSINFTYTCSDWVIGEMAIQQSNGTYKSYGDPLYRFTC